MTIQNNLSGKTALVTGASRGIGRATALLLGQAGAQVIVHYSSGEKEATAVVTDIRNAGGKAEKVAADLRTADGPHLLAERVRAIIGGRLDILVANAGIAKAATIAETTVEDFDALFAVNVRAPYFLVQHLLPVMCKGSSVILLSSLAAHAAVGDLSAYSATKGAIDTLVKHFASALGERGIRVNAVAPGVVPTEMSNFTKTDAGRHEFRFFTGLRPSEEIALVRDFDEARGTLSVTKARVLGIDKDTTKTREDRIIQLSPRALAVLKRQLALYRDLKKLAALVDHYASLMSWRATWLSRGCSTGC